METIQAASKGMRMRQDEEPPSPHALLAVYVMACGTGPGMCSAVRSVVAHLVACGVRGVPRSELGTGRHIGHGGGKRPDFWFTPLQVELDAGVLTYEMGARHP